MPTVVTASRGTGNNNTENIRVRDVSPGISLLEPDEAQITTFMMNIKGGSKVAINSEVEHFEDEFTPRFDTLAASLTAGATTMTVSNYQYFRKNDLVKIANREVVRVTATPSAAAVSIKRAVGSTAALAANSGDQLFIMSDAHEEGSSRRDLLSVQKSRKFNYLQIMREPFGVTVTNQDSDLYGEKDDLKWQRRKSATEHKRRMDQAFLHGERYLDTTGTQWQYHTGGILEFIQTNVVDAGGDLTELEFEDFIRKAFRYGSSDKVLLLSPKAATVVNGFARGKLETRPEDSKYGITMSRYHNAGRNVRLIEHKQLTNDNLDNYDGFAGYIICLDLPDIKMRYLGPVVTRYNEEIQDKGVDSRIDEYRSQVCIQMMQERNHALLKGITG